MVAHATKYSGNSNYSGGRDRRIMDNSQLSLKKKISELFQKQAGYGGVCLLSQLFRKQL
jgi:hypothetical protein